MTGFRTRDNYFYGTLYIIGEIPIWLIQTEKVEGKCLLRINRIGTLDSLIDFLDQICCILYSGVSSEHGKNMVHIVQTKYYTYSGTAIWHMTLTRVI